MAACRQRPTTVAEWRLSWRGVTDQLRDAHARCRQILQPSYVERERAKQEKVRSSIYRGGEGDVLFFFTFFSFPPVGSQLLLLVIIHPPYSA